MERVQQREGLCKRVHVALRLSTSWANGMPTGDGASVLALANLFIPRSSGDIDAGFREGLYDDTHKHHKPLHVMHTNTSLLSGAFSDSDGGCCLQGQRPLEEGALGFVVGGGTQAPTPIQTFDWLRALTND